MAVMTKPQNKNAQPARQAPRAVVPFVAAAHEHTEVGLAPTPSPITLSTSAQQIGPFDVKSFGFLRHINLNITASGGVIGAATLAADWPFNIIKEITLKDVNGTPIFGPLGGYALLHANILAGVGFQQDPRDLGNYSGGVNPNVQLRIPVEISEHDAMGSLANQNAAAPYKVEITIAPTTELWTGAIGTAPTITIKATLEAWTQPNEIDRSGNPQAVYPPLHGTTQYWSRNIKQISVGENTSKVERVGNYIQNILVIARDASGVRTDAVFPDPFRVMWDARVHYAETQQYRKNVGCERIAGGTVDTGVFYFSLNHPTLGRSGNGGPSMWLPTVQATRLEIEGSSATAGTIEIIVNDVAPVEVVPQERYVEQSASGFHPNADYPAHG